MNEQDIFIAAMGRHDSADRQQFLDEACTGDDQLRQRLEQLMEKSQDLGSFLEHPLLEADADAWQACDAKILRSASSTCDNDRDGISPERFEVRVTLKNPVDEIPLGFLQPSSNPDSLGRLGRLGHYEILEVIGSGAFGIVLRAYDEKLQRVVAIKVLAPELAATSPARRRFKREATASASVRHENVVAIHAVEDEPIPHLVMEYIPGKTLQERLDEHGPLDLPYVLRVGKQIADGLAAAHAQGLIHRDIKPGNILLEGGMEERVKITDFGLACAADEASMTQSGKIAGTPMYMAPEQAYGYKLDQRADLFSLGSVLYQMLSGRAPFRAPTTMAVLRRVANDAARPIQEIIPEVPEWTCELVSHLHAKEPERRYASATEVSKLLAQCTVDLQQGSVPKIPAPPGVEKSDEAVSEKIHSQSRHAFPGMFWKVATAVVVLLGLLGITEATNLTNFSGTVIRLATGSGTLVIETDDPSVKIVIDGEEVQISGGSVEKITLRPGQYKIAALKDGKPIKQELVSITRNGKTVVRMSLEPGVVTASSPDMRSQDGWPADAPPAANSPIDIDLAKAHQEAWAKYLGVPVEFSNSIGMKFRLIPPGEFLMGSTPEEIEAALVVANEYQAWQERISSEAPQHKVILTQPLYFGATEVTQAQYEQVMGTNPSYLAASGEGKDAIAGLETGNHPVGMVNWNDAAKFCIELSQHEERKPFHVRSEETVTPLEGTGYRLPTEAEWEFACRAGTTSWFWSGDEDANLIQVGWFKSNSEGRSHAVGELTANPFGLSDVHGNVWEWVQDSFDQAYYEKFREKAAINPSGPFSTGSHRVLRGGSWGSHPLACRSSARYFYPPMYRAEGIGFRVVLTVVAVK